MREKQEDLNVMLMRLRKWTLKDKDSMFRAKRPDDHIVELIAVPIGGPVVILREWHFGTVKACEAHYKHLKGLLTQ